MRELQNTQQLGAYLRALRKTHGITQRALGERLGVSAMRISTIESDPGSVSLGQVLNILHHLGARVYVDSSRAERSANARVASTGEW